MYVHLGHFAVNSIAEYARSSKLAQLFVRRQLKVFACIELLYGSVNQIFFPRIYSSPPVINMMYLLKYMYVSTFEEKT